MAHPYQEWSPLPVKSVREQLDRILQSEFFLRSQRMTRFLRFIVEETLAGNDESLSEYTIGLQVFDRGEDFDPRVDSLVRVDARRLRSKLQEYYQGMGSDDLLVIDVPKGTYVPRFRSPEMLSTAEDASEVAGQPTPSAYEGDPTPAHSLWQDRESDVSDTPRSKTAPVGRKRLLTLAATAGALLAGLASVAFLSNGHEETIESIAVLPLQNLSSAPDQDFFVDGMHEALIAELAQISALAVISRTSVNRYRNTDRSIPEIARELDVDAVVEGSVLRVGDNVRITAQLIAAEPERHLWARSYDGDMRDVLSLHSQVARDVAVEIHVAVTPEEEGRLATARQVDPEAYEHYLLGRQLCKSLSESELSQGIERFRQAIGRDPTFAPPHAGLARCYLALALLTQPREEAETRVKTAVLRALKLDDELAEAHAMNGYAKLFFDWDFSGEQDFKRALELDPNSVTTLIDYGWYLTVSARFDEALATYERAVELDPLGVTPLVYMGWGSLLARRYDKSILHFQEAIELDSDSTYGYLFLGMSYVKKGMIEEAARSAERVEALAPLSQDQNVLQVLGWVYASLGRRGDAERMLGRLMNLAEHRELHPGRLASVYGALGDIDTAFQHLQEAVEESALLHFLHVHPAWDPLRSDPRFDELLSRQALGE